MKDLKPTCRIAVVQAAPVLFDKTACTDKAVRLIAECARSGAELIVFPELFIPGYPYGMTFGFTVGSRKAAGRQDWKQYYDNSLLADGCVIEGTVENCVLFRGVKVKKGAVVKNCVLMQDTVVEAGVELDCVVTDKNVRITADKKLSGTKSFPVYVQKSHIV